MQTPHHVPREFHQNATKVNHGFRFFLALLLATGAVALVISALSATGAEGASNLSAAEAAPVASPRPRVEECVQNTAWPAAFQIPFTAYVLLPGKTSYEAWKGNTLYYQYDQSAGVTYFKSQFPKCVNLPGVPLSFFGQPCEFYFPLSSQNPKQYDAYVYATQQRKYFVLAQNLGPQFQDFVARFQNVLQSCLPAPPPKAHLPMGNPPGVAVDWFITAGHRGLHSKKPTLPAAADIGYYAAVAQPTGPNNQYKPPYSFGGAVPGIHKPDQMRFVPGQLIYDWQNFSIVDSLPAGTFTPPSGFTEIKGCQSIVIWPGPEPKPSPLPMNCPACHMTDLSAQSMFYTEQRRPPRNCPTPSPTPLK